ncbi:hypothetical protein EVJ58_g8838 [Rhodofomes roseus]|uniref:Arrestin-like N-terminal domain-containing protein n=1 Tax=Rhodofomes roseus TaxID=34475 RepID=A0A4Y9XWN7_9APHY|nr:hypothetical protein EVJ58_g8838 [Rhodofomes roseus]
MSPTSGIHLSIDNPICYVGETIAGTVTLDLEALRSDRVSAVAVHVSGILQIGYLDNFIPQQLPTLRRFQLVKVSRPIWNEGERPDLDSHWQSAILREPFKWKVSNNAPPSIESNHKNHNCYVNVTYTIEVVGLRPGLLRLDRRVRRTVTVQPPVDQAELNTLELLRRGYQGPWRQGGISKHVRKLWFLGAREYVEVLLATPEIVYPVNADIPFTLGVITKSLTKPYKSGRESWPSRPARQSDVHLALNQIVNVHVQSSKVGWNAKQAGGAFEKLKLGDVHMERQEERWEAYEDGNGRWERKTVLRSTFRLERPPYTHINIPFHHGTADVEVKVRRPDSLSSG